MGPLMVRHPRAWSTARLALVALVVIGCASGSGGSPDNGTTVRPSGPLVILEPLDGATVATDRTTVTGTGPEGATVVRDISRAPDDDTKVVGGRWSMSVMLAEGDNELVFRIGDDESTAVRLRVVYDPNSASPRPSASVAALATASAAPSVPVQATPSVAPSATTQATNRPAPTPYTTPTSTPAATPTPKPSPKTFGDGTWTVGVDIAAGTYRLREPSFFLCEWTRTFMSGDGYDVTVDQTSLSTFDVVTIGSDDKTFQSDGCGEWSSDLSRVSYSTTEFEDGTYIVGTDIKAGTYKNTLADDLCFWKRLSGFGGTGAEVIDQNLPVEGFPLTEVVQITPTDKGFYSYGCGVWQRQ